MAPSVTSAAPKAPPAPTGTAPVGAPRVPSAARVAQGRAATELGGVAGAAVAADGFKQLKNADNVGQRLAGEAPSAAPGTPPPSALAPMSRVAASTASAMDAANAPTPFTRPRAPGQPGRIESAAMQAGLGVVGMAYGGDPDVIGGGGARPIYGVTLPAGPDLALSEAIGPTSHAGYGAAGTPQPLGPIARAARHHLGTASTGSRGALSITGAGETGPVGAAVVDIAPEQMLAGLPASEQLDMRQILGLLAEEEVIDERRRSKEQGQVQQLLSQSQARSRARLLEMLSSSYASLTSPDAG